MIMMMMEMTNKLKMMMRWLYDNDDGIDKDINENDDGDENDDDKVNEDDDYVIIWW